MNRKKRRATVQKTCNIVVAVILFLGFAVLSSTITRHMQAQVATAAPIEQAPYTRCR